MQPRLGASALLCLIGLSGAVYAIDDGHGKDWASPGIGRGLTWEQVAAVCATDGTTACNGKVGSVDLKDWVWATAPQVTELFGYYAPAILSSPTQSVGGYEYYAPAAQFQNSFGYTLETRGCPTYQPCWWSRFTSGMTATTDSYTTPATPYGAEVHLDLENGMGGFSISKPFRTNLGGGLWLWRPTGYGTDQVHAYDDYGQPPTPGGGVAVPSVLVNDWVAGVRATIASVNLSQVSSSVAGVSLDLADGSVDVAMGTAAGTYTLVYHICAKAAPSNCDDAVVTVTVKSFPIVAVNDVGYASMAAGGVAIANVLANDKLGGLPATTAMVSLAQVSSSNPGVRLNPADGSISIAPGTPHGSHTLTYKICELANLANCAQATATVNPYSIDAVNDSARASSKTGGVAIASVLNNDWFNGARATTAKVKIVLPAQTPKGITLNLSTGAVTVAPKTSSGLYSFAYRICEIASLANCDQATITLDLSGRSE